MKRYFTQILHQDGALHSARGWFKRRKDCDADAAFVRQLDHDLGFTDRRYRVVQCVDNHCVVVKTLA